MRPFFKIAFSAGVALAFATAPAFAGVVISYDFTGSASAGVNNANLTDFPANPEGIQTVIGQAEIDTQTEQDFAAMVGFGDDAPIEFLGGAAAAGFNATATTTLVATATVTNDGAMDEEFFWQGLIFGGGVGLVIPDFSSAGCNLPNIASCDAFLGGPTSIQSGESAVLNFLATIDGVELFSGEISVDITGATATFNNIALDGFGLAANNSSFYNWQNTLINQSLGVIGAGESAVLEFIITSTVSADSFGTCNAFFDLTGCVAALAGFGDPPPGGDQEGGTTMGRSLRSAVFYSLIAPASEIPVPGAIWLFASAIGAGFGARKLRKQKAA